MPAKGSSSKLGSSKQDFAGIGSWANSPALSYPSGSGLDLSPPKTKKSSASSASKGSSSLQTYLHASSSSQSWSPLNKRAGEKR